MVLGGGNAKKLDELPPRCRLGDNANAFLGGFRLWEQPGGAAAPAKPGPGGKSKPAAKKKAAAAPKKPAAKEKAAARKKAVAHKGNGAAPSKSRAAGR